jgi:hypothetical protein
MGVLVAPYCSTSAQTAGWVQKDLWRGKGTELRTHRAAVEYSSIIGASGKHVSVFQKLILKHFTGPCSSRFGEKWGGSPPPCLGST